MSTDQKILEKSILSHPEETVRIIENYEEDEISTFIESLPIELSVLVLKKMTRFKAVRILEKLDQKTASLLIEKLPVSVAKVLLWQMDESLCNRLLDDLPPQSSKPLKQTLKYTKNTVGAYIDPLVFTLQENDTVHQGLEKIKKKHPPILQQVFIIAPDQSLAGIIDLKELITIDGETLISSIMNTNPHKIRASMDISFLHKEQSWDESISYLPVVDGDGIFLGVVTKKMLTDIKPEKKAADFNALQAGVALGDLYRIGLSSFFYELKEVMDNQNIK